MRFLFSDSHNFAYDVGEMQNTEAQNTEAERKKNIYSVDTEKYWHLDLYSFIYTESTIAFIEYHMWFEENT